MNLQTLRRDYKERILQIADHCMAENIRLFGSIVRGEMSDDSDIDFLVHMKPNSGFGIGGMKYRLEDLLQRNVDVVPDTVLHPLIKMQILHEAVGL